MRANRGGGGGGGGGGGEETCLRQMQRISGRFRQF